MFVTALALFINWATFTPDTAKLFPPTPDADRRKAAIRFYNFAAHPAAPTALPALEKSARTDPEAWVRANAVMAIGRVAQAHKKPCPAVLLDALTDEDRDSVRIAAHMALDWVKPLPLGSTEKLLKVATTGDADQRDMGYSLLATHAPKDPAALKVLRAAADAPGVMKRHNARCALFRATNDLSDMFPHIVDVYILRAGTPEPPDDAPEDAKREYASLGLHTIAVARFLARWTEDRPGELLDEMMTALTHESPRHRLVVVRQLERFAEALTEPEPKWDDDEFDPKKRRAGMKLIMGTPALRQRLKDMTEKDRDPDVRAAAREVLDRKP